MFYKKSISKYSQESTHAFNEKRDLLKALLKRGSNTVFSCEYCKISKNIYFEEHPRMAVSEVRINQPYQRLCEYTFYSNIGCGMNIGRDRCFYIILLITNCIAFNN